MTTAFNSVSSQRLVSLFNNEPNASNAGSISSKLQKNSDSTAVPSFVDSATQNVMSASLLKNLAPDISPGPVQADPEAFSQQVSQMMASISNLTLDEASKAMQQMDDSLVVISNMSEFDISTIVNGFSGKAADILQTIFLAAQYNQNINREQASANNMMARGLSELSANKTVQAGVDNRYMAVKQGTVSIATTVVSGAVQMKALSKQNNAIKTHGNKSIELNRNADDISSRAIPGTSGRGIKRPMDSQISTDPKRLKLQAGRLRSDAKIEDIQQQLRANDASKMQIQGALIGQAGQSAAILASAQGHIDKAQSEADAQRFRTDESIFAARKDADEREQQAIAQFKDELLKLLSRILEIRSNAVNSMAGNLKG